MLSISNIAWTSENDEKVYGLMEDLGFTGLEIAPTRIISESPYDKLLQAREWADRLRREHGLNISSMQSIWYGIKENLFGSIEEKGFLIEYTKKAIDFAQAIGCKNLVFGCPRNRRVPEGADPEAAVSFFRELGDYALCHDTVLAMEANPPVYNTNYINDTKSAVELVEKVGSKGFLLNLDTGTMIENGEDISVLEGRGHLINHVHISEPGLNLIEKRELHNELFKILNEIGYERYVSIEMGNKGCLENVKSIVHYVSKIYQKQKTQRIP